MKRFEYVERKMEERCLVKNIARSDVIGTRLKERPQTSWMGSMKGVYIRGMSLEQERVVVCDRNYKSSCISINIMQPGRSRWEIPYTSSFLTGLETKMCRNASGCMCVLTPCLGCPSIRGKADSYIDR